MGYRIRELRERASMTQMQLAEKSGISRGTIIALEGGGAKVTTTKTLRCLADALGVTIDSLFYADDAQHIKQKEG